MWAWISIKSEIFIFLSFQFGRNQGHQGNTVDTVGRKLPTKIAGSVNKKTDNSGKCGNADNRLCSHPDLLAMKLLISCSLVRIGTRTSMRRSGYRRSSRERRRLRIMV